ncbi:hypothetical protein FKP32DRAFT_1588704 [Trametes sanguinea]|nr:hypothetical protein FKP32DRAFT_1588704 [Trametes sanguinea]
MIFSTVLVYCLCALVAVFQSTSPAFLTSLTSSFNTPALSTFTNLLHIAGYTISHILIQHDTYQDHHSLAPRPTLPAPAHNSSIDSSLINKITHTTMDYDYVLYTNPLDLNLGTLGDSDLDGLCALGYSSVEFSRKYLRPTAAALVVSLGLVILCTPRTPHQNCVHKNSNRTPSRRKPDTATRMGGIIH